MPQHTHTYTDWHFTNNAQIATHFSCTLYTRIVSLQYCIINNFKGAAETKAFFIITNLIQNRCGDLLTNYGGGKYSYEAANTIIQSRGEKECQIYKSCP